MLIIVIHTEVFVCCLKVFYDAFDNYEPQVGHWIFLRTAATHGFVFAERNLWEGVLAPVLTVSAKKLHPQRQVHQRDISGFQEKLHAGWAN